MVVKPRRGWVCAGWFDFEAFYFSGWRDFCQHRVGAFCFVYAAVSVVTKIPCAGRDYLGDHGNNTVCPGVRRNPRELRRWLASGTLKRWVAPGALSRGSLF